MTMDLDSTVCQVHGHAKQGAAYGYTHALGYHPLLATRADTGEVLPPASGPGGPHRPRHRPLRRRAPRPGPPRRRQRRANHARRLRLLVGQDHPGLPPHQLRYSITVRQTTPIPAAIATIAADAWVDMISPDGGLAQVAETRDRGDRLIARRTRLVGAQAELFPTWRDHASSPTESA
jgi:hypothetical protein